MKESTRINLITVSELSETLGVSKYIIRQFTLDETFPRPFIAGKSKFWPRESIPAISAWIEKKFNKGKTNRGIAIDEAMTRIKELDSVIETLESIADKALSEDIVSSGHVLRVMRPRDYDCDVTVKARDLARVINLIELLRIKYTPVANHEHYDAV